METDFSIQQVAKRTGLSIDTLRYYERIGLIEPVKRASSGHRRYRQEDLDWIGLLINLRETGMPIAQMIHFAQLHHQGPATATERLLLLEHHQHALQEQMQKLQQHGTALQQKIDRKKMSLASHASARNKAETERADEALHSTRIQEEKRSIFMEKNEGCVALVTGASSGIGEATAWALAAHGIRVAVAARRTEQLEALVERIQQAGGRRLP